MHFLKLYEAVDLVKRFFLPKTTLHTLYFFYALRLRNIQTLQKIHGLLHTKDERLERIREPFRMYQLVFYNHSVLTFGLYYERQ